MEHDNAEYIIFFDGVCKLCNYTVNFLIRHDKKNCFRFAPLQWEVSKNILGNNYPNSKALNTLIYFENGIIYKESTAVLKIFNKLPFPFFLLYSFIIIPKFIRNSLYRYISRNRFKWFGKNNSCMVPSEEIQNKFIN